MCGITGIFAFTEHGKNILSQTSAATYSLRKRGPDGEGLFFHNNVALGHRRLKIIDTSDNASQPMNDSSERFTIVFNGEIFNFKELRKGLLAKGVKLKSESDTEVLLNLFVLEKEKCLEKLDGEFAFAIYDKKDASLFLARDRFGIKPLYYFADADKFIFGSEMKAVLAYGVPKQIDEASLQTYLHLNYIPSPNSIFKGVNKFPSASFAKIKNSEFGIQSYYEINSQPIKLNYEKAESQLKNLLESSVRQRMISDVPLGCFLSGGIDSSIISTIASQNTKHLKTFSIGYKDEKYFDETSFANLVAKKIKSEHTVFSLSNDDLFSNLHSVLDSIDEPFADSSALAVHLLSKQTQKHVKVALSGDGADELFGGYNKHAAELKARKGGLASSLVKSSKSILKTLPKSRNTKVGNKIRQLQKFSEGLDMNSKERYWKWAGFSNENVLIKNQKEYKERKDEILKYVSDDFDSVLYSDVKLVLENDMLVKVDRMSMDNSLEVRVPFLDHKIVDFAFSLPSEFKIDQKKSKKILKDAFRKELPVEILSRRKQGFEVPLLKWFRTELKFIITDDLLNEKLVKEQNLFDGLEIKKLIAQLFSNNPDDSVAKIWALIVFQHWWKKHYA